MSALGYKFREDEHDKIKNRISSVSASDNYRLAKLQETSPDTGKIKWIGEYFYQRTRFFNVSCKNAH